jgi:YegS/Rv2252/BmrU family lipid kinase
LNIGRTVFIVNPHAGNGSTGQEWRRIEHEARRLLGSFETCMTTGPGDATRIARDHLLKGCMRIVCVGGDGTLNEVVNGFMNETGPIRPDALLGFIPNGTGCDIARTVPLDRDPGKSLEILQRGHVREIDLGRLRFQDHGGRPAVRYFHNIASFGLGGEVVDRVNRTSKASGPFLSFIWATVMSIFSYDKKRIRLRTDDDFKMEVTIWNVAVANGRYHGGGMCVAPDAVIDDGLFHVTVIGDMTLPQVFLNLPRLYNGRIKTIGQVFTRTALRVFAESEQTVLLDVDGEQPGRLPVTIEMVPGAVKMITRP